jgi:hypothetical protein
MPATASPMPLVASVGAFALLSALLLTVRRRAWRPE